MDFSILDIPTILTPPIELKDITYNCPCCDYEIDLNIIVDDNSFITCDNCDHTIKFKIKKV